MSASYYALVASFVDYGLDSESRNLDLKAVLSDIEDSVSESDMAKVRLLYMRYDCENLVSLHDGRTSFSELGMLSREEAEEELKNPARLPEALGRVIDAFREDDTAEDGVDTGKTFGNQLLQAYYELCSKSDSVFLREYTKAEQTIRNIIAGTVSRKHSLNSDSTIVGSDDNSERIRSASGADFGMQGEFPYTERIVQIMTDEENVVEREHMIDQVKWQIAEDLSQFSYFDMDAVLAYLVRINLIVRWMDLDEDKGNGMLDRLVGRLSAEEKINKL